MHNTINTPPIHEKSTTTRPKKTLLAASATGTGLPSGTPHMALGMEIGKVGTVGTIGTIGTRPTRNILLYATVLTIPTIQLTMYYHVYHSILGRYAFPGLTECGPPAAPSLTMRDFLWGCGRKRRRGGNFQLNLPETFPRQ